MARPRKARSSAQLGVVAPAAPGPTVPRIRVWWALLVLATVVAYWPAIRAPYVFDDIASIPANASIRQVWPPSIALSPPVNTTVSGRPVVNYSLALNYWLNETLGVDQSPYPEGANKTLMFHVVNLLLHLACGALLYAILRRTIASQRYDVSLNENASSVALVVSAIWLLHPIQSEAVNYIGQRTELLVSLCYLGTLYSAIRAFDAEERSATLWALCAIAVCLIGMWCKEVMFTAPLSVMLYDRAFRAPSWRSMFTRRRWFYPSLFATMLVVISGVAANARFGTAGFGSGISSYSYLYSQAWAIAHYLRLVILPTALTFDYGQQPIAGLRGLPGALLLSAFGIATLVAWARVARWGWFAFLGAWFFLLLAPSSSIVPIATEIAAERRIYLALAAVLVLFVLAAREVFQRKGWRAAPWFPGVVCALLAVVTFARSRTYAQPLALWRDAVVNAPDNPRAYQSLAAELIRQDPPQFAAADTMYRRAIALDPSYVEAYTGLAAIAINLNNQARAESLLTRVLSLDPGNAEATQVLGRMYLRAGEPEKALPYLERYANAFPGDNSLVAIGTVYFMLGRMDQGVSALRQALRYNPSRGDAMRLLGGFLAEQGNSVEALPLLEGAVRADPNAPLERALLSLALAQLGRADAAAQEARAAATLGRASPRVLVLAGRAMLTVKRIAEADEYFSDAIRVNPSQADAIEWLRRTRSKRRWSAPRDTCEGGRLTAHIADARHATTRSGKLTPCS